MVSQKDKKDAQAYKETASKGMDLMWPVRINGRSHRADISWPYHVTIMLFDTEHDSKEEAHKIASKLSLNPPDPKEIRIELGTMQSRNGYKIYNINLTGPETKRIEELYNEFSDMGFDNNYKFQAHISVDKETWDEFKNKEGKTAFETGIEFLPAELHCGTKIVATYKPKYAREWGEESVEPDELRASENMNVIREAAFFTELRDSLVLSLPEETFKNWLLDNPDYKREILNKHEERVRFHFGNSELANYALTHGIEKAYKLMRNK